MGQHNSGYSLLFSFPYLVDLDDLLSDPEHAGLRRAFALWLTQVLLPSRLPGVTVPTVEKLEEVSPMIQQHAIDWTIPWKEEIREECRKEGRKEGEATLLRRLLRRKFGPLDPVVEQRVDSAEAEQLLEWGDRFVTANTLDEIFDGNGR